MNVSEDQEPSVTHCIYTSTTRYMYTNALSVQGKELLEMFSTKNPISIFFPTCTHIQTSQNCQRLQKRFFFSTADSRYYVFHVISRICNTTEKSTIIYVTIFIPI